MNDGDCEPGQKMYLSRDMGEAKLASLHSFGCACIGAGLPCLDPYPVPLHLIPAQMGSGTILECDRKHPSQPYQQTDHRLVDNQNK